MFLFPDRVLVYESGKVGVIGYDQLRISISQRQFVENSRAPQDARVVGQTWQYVNKKGGPDRRFANNPTLPICLYEEVHFTSATGLNEIIQLSRCGIGESFEQAVATLGSHLTEARKKSTAPSAPANSYFIGRNGQDLGDLSIAVIRGMLSRGELSLLDYYFDFESNAWLTLDQIPELK